MERSPDFDAKLIVAMRKLRGYAFMLTRCRDRADDLMQTTLLKALRYHTHFRHGEMAKWLAHIMHNEHVSCFRRETREHTVISFEGDAYDIPGLITLPDQLEAVAYKEHIADLSTLPLLHREVLLMAVEGLTYQAMAHKLGVPLGTIRSRLNRARQLLSPELTALYLSGIKRLRSDYEQGPRGV